MDNFLSFCLGSKKNILLGVITHVTYYSLIVITTDNDWRRVGLKPSYAMASVGQMEQSSPPRLANATSPNNTNTIFTPTPVWPGTGIVFERFLCLFISLSATLRENGWTDLHEIFREGVEWPRDDLIKFWVNSGKRVGGSKVNLLSPAVAIWFDCGLLAVLCCHLATENVMKLLFLAFGYVAARGRVCCAAHHSLFTHM